MSFSLTTSAFENGSAIPGLYTCEGKDISPPLVWNNIPDNAKSLVLIMYDPDAPRMTWYHWVLYNIPVTARGLEEDISAESLPEGTQQGVNSWRKPGYGGPCPPNGTHRYFFSLYALDTTLTGLNNPSAKELKEAMKGHVIGGTQLMGTYKKK